MHPRIFLFTLLALAATSCATSRPAPSSAICIPPALPPRPVSPAPPAKGERPAELGRVTFAAVGDVLPHVAVKQSAERWTLRNERGASTNHDGYDALFAPVAAEIAHADVAFANLETPVSVSGDEGTREYMFNAPKALLESLKQTGFDVVSFANNHVCDQGPKGLAETLNALGEVKLPASHLGP